MSIEDDIACLEAVPTLRLLGPHALRILAIGCESRALDEGEVLFAAGEPADCGYVIQDGALALVPVAPSPSGGRAAPVAGETLATAGPGALLGELALIIETARPVTATATEPSTVMRISRHLFRKTLEGFPDAAERLRDHMAARASETADQILQVGATLDVETDEARE
jgi:CRP-like cAMP-binding protein